jgi:hypothetical protein
LPYGSEAKMLEAEIGRRTENELAKIRQMKNALAQGSSDRKESIAHLILPLAT